MGRDNIQCDKITVGDVRDSTAVAIGKEITQNVTINQTLSREEIQNRRNLDKLRQAVKLLWIDGVLKHSLYQEALIRLNMTDHSDAVENQRWNMILQTSSEAGQPLAPGTRIIDVFDQTGQHMLILGVPGSGKTTTLLELARDMLARTEQDQTLPIPVVFNLSSWSISYQNFADWLVDELITKYSVSKKVARRWVERDELLLLLDGLDEVKMECREACVNGINGFRREHGSTPLVICSRIADYETLSVQLQLQGAVLLQPLTPQQIEDYFDRAGAGLAAVRQVWQNDSLLQELVKEPLMLSIMTLAYEGVSIDALASPQLGSTEARRKHLFDIFIYRMFERVTRTLNESYNPKQTIRWVAWLAQKMIEQGQSIFLLERMRSSWLHPGAQELLHRGIGVLVVGLAFGLGAGTYDGLLTGLLAGQLTFWLKGSERPTELLALSWRRFAGGFVIGWGLGLILLVVVLGLLLVFGLANLQVVGLHDLLLLGLICGLCLGPISGLVVGLRGMEIPISTTPNQGIHQSVTNAVIFGMVGGVVVGTCSALVFGLLSRPYNGPGLGLPIGMIAGLQCGGTTVISHYSLRLLLCLNGHIPLNYVRFLDYAAERIFLRKVGGGYIFIHRLIMEHFAAMSDADIKRIADSVTRSMSR